MPLTCFVHSTSLLATLYPTSSRAHLLLIHAHTFSRQVEGNFLIPYTPKKKTQNLYNEYQFRVTESFLFENNRNFCYISVVKRFVYESYTCRIFVFIASQFFNRFRPRSLTQFSEYRSVFGKKGTNSSIYHDTKTRGHSRGCGTGEKNFNSLIGYTSFQGACHKTEIDNQDFTELSS